MIDKVNPQDCAICGSCVNACPVNAISLIKPYLDFDYPEIDYEKCINCNKCEVSCPVINNFERTIETSYPKSYIGRNKKKDERMVSTSGGIFILFAKYIIQVGGYVCGAIMDDDFHVKHVLSNDIDVVHKMMGSKYVQSDTTNVFKDIKILLDNDCIVLFTGCGCQIAGLRTYLGKEYNNLFLVELICHGVPSDKMLQTYIGMHEKKQHKKAMKIEFRAKDTGWHNSSLKIVFEDDSEYIKPVTLDGYMRGYFGRITFKSDCYKCQFKAFSSGSDILIGDFWGAEVEIPELDDNTGFSTIIALTPKGDEILSCVDFEMQEYNFENIFKYNKNIMLPSVANPLRNEFYEYINEFGIEKSIRKYLIERPEDKIKRITRSCIRNIYYFITGKEKPFYS